MLPWRNYEHGDARLVMNFISSPQRKDFSSQMQMERMLSFTTYLPDRLFDGYSIKPIRPNKRSHS